MEAHMVSRQGNAQDLSQPKSYPTHAGALIAISIAFLTITIFFTSLRFFVRGYMIKSLGWDDWMILLALASFLCQASILIHLAWIIQHYDLSYIKPLAEALEVSNIYALDSIPLTILITVCRSGVCVLHPELTVP
jgi:hypothetical protein